MWGILWNLKSTTVELSRSWHQLLVSFSFARGCSIKFSMSWTKPLYLQLGSRHSIAYASLCQVLRYILLSSNGRESELSYAVCQLSRSSLWNSTRTMRFLESCTAHNEGWMVKICPRKRLSRICFFMPCTLFLSITCKLSADWLISLRTYSSSKSKSGHCPVQAAWLIKCYVFHSSSFLDRSVLVAGGAGLLKCTPVIQATTEQSLLRSPNMLTYHEPFGPPRSNFPNF